MDLLAKILLTTSRNPTPRIRTFCHDLAEVMPNVAYVNRGKMSNDEVAEKALEYGADRVVIVDRRHGRPGVLRFFRVGESGLVSTPPVINVVSIKLQRDFGVSRVKPAFSISFEVSDKSDDVPRLVHALSDFFGISMLREKEAAEAGFTALSVSHDKSVRIVMTFMAEPHQLEVGPRILISRVEW